MSPPDNTPASRIPALPWWYPAALIALAGIGAAALAQPIFVTPEARGAENLWARQYWQAAFDACSAACGCGLLTYDFSHDYTEAGRWLLTGIGIGGAALFLTAVAGALGPLLGRRVSRVRLLLYFLAGCAALLLVGAAIDAGGGAGWIWNLVSAFASLGWSAGPMTSPQAVGVAVASVLGGAGLLWILASSPMERRSAMLQRWAPWKCASLYLLVILSAAGLITLTESPRSMGPLPLSEGSASADLSEAPLATRAARSLIQAASAAGGGVATEDLRHRYVRDGTQVILAGLLLIGATPGAAAGGVSAAFFFAALASVWSGRGRPPELERWLRAGAGLTLLMFGLAVLTAIGLLIIENLTASRFASPPTFADALLDACSAVAGAGLTSGVTESVTSRNLVSGIQLSANLYQYGMVWLMGAMLLGRILPILLLARFLRRDENTPC